MNYIKRLEAENKEAKRRLQLIQDEIMEFRAFLASDKFQGTDYRDGSRMDWIGTKDVDYFLQLVHSKAMNGC
jgi:hypothetical protein